MSLHDLDPIPRWHEDSQAIQQAMTHHYAGESDPGIQLLANYIAGLDATHAMVHVPKMPESFTKTTLAAVGEIYDNIADIALTYLRKGDDRLFTFVSSYLLPCLLMHDPAGAPSTKERAARRQHDWHNTQARINAYTTVGWAAFVLLLEDYRTLAYQQTMHYFNNPKQDMEATTAAGAQDRLKSLVRSLNKGVPFADAFKQTHTTTTKIKDITPFADLFATGNHYMWRPDEHTAAQHAAENADLDHESRPIFLPNGNGGASSHNHTRTDVLNSMGEFIRGLDVSKAPYVTTTTNMHLKLFLNNTSALAAFTRMAIAVQSDELMMTARTYADLHIKKLTLYVGSSPALL
jgi:hypothetical protein